MESIQTVLLFILTVITASVAGYGVANLLLPRECSEYRFLTMPVLGYPAFILLTHFISGSFRLSVLTSSFIGYGLLFCVSVYTYFSLDRNRGVLYLMREAGSAALVSLPMILVVLWPMFAIGARTYLASVNPDFFLGLADNEWLTSHATNVIKSQTDTNTYDIFAQISGTITESARFRGGFVAILLHGLFHISQRTGLTLAIALFHYCMPASLYVMVRVAFGETKRVAYLSAALLGISSSISLGYLSYYIGQASALGFMPLLFAIWYLCLTRPAWRTFLLATILTCAMWVMYLALVPYVAGPVLGLAVYLLVIRQLRLSVLAAMAGGMACALLAIHIRMMGMLTGTIQAWVSLMGRAVKGPYFVDFVTERFFPMFYGLTIYSLETSAFHHVLGDRPYNWLLYSFAISITVGLILSFSWWARTVKDRRSRAFGVCCVLIYGMVVLNYIFVHPYGYASFKNAMWLQFMLMFIAAFGIEQIYVTFVGAGSFWSKAAAAGAFGTMALPLILGNLSSSLEYGVKGLGHDTDRGYTVLVHNVSGNQDYFELDRAVSKFVRPTESIGLALLNSGQNGWVEYYLQHFRLSLLGQSLFPGDDEMLPDIVSRRVKDVFGNVNIDSPRYFHGARDDYYLVNRPGVVNSEIVKNPLPRILWQDGTFVLVRSSDTPDFMFVGRGFYRAEYRKARTYYMPQELRWTAEGAELYLLRAGAPGREYRLALTGLSGPGLPSARRTIEFFHNKKPFGSPKVINGFGHIVSDPFYPTGDVDFLVFRIKEDVSPSRRPFAVWNKELAVEYRRLNLAVSDIELIPPEHTVSPFKMNEAIQGPALFTRSLAFDGIEPNWWVREEMAISLPRTPGASAVCISIFVPGQASLRFPFGVTLSVDGVSEQRYIKKPGQALLTMSLAKSQDPGITSIQLKPSQFFLADGFAATQRPAVQSVRLDSISFLESVGK